MQENNNNIIILISNISVGK